MGDVELVPKLPRPPELDGELDNIENTEDLYELVDDEDIDNLSDEYGFESEEEMLDFVLGREEYEDTNALTDAGHADMQQNSRDRGAWYKCPECVEEIDEMLDSGALRSDIDVDPTYNFRVFDEEEEAEYKHGEDEVKHETTYAVWCDTHGRVEDEEERKEFFWYAREWFED